MNQSLVLIAEGDLDVRNLLRHAVESAGYRAVETCDGRTAVRILHTAEPVALIADVLMPDMNGMELCRRVRNSSDSRTAVLMVSSSVHDDALANLGGGADRYLPVPIDPERLVAEMRTVITAKNAGTTRPAMIRPHPISSGPFALADGWQRG